MTSKNKLRDRAEISYHEKIGKYFFGLDILELDKNFDLAIQHPLFNNIEILDPKAMIQVQTDAQLIKSFIAQFVDYELNGVDGFDRYLSYRSKCPAFEKEFFKLLTNKTLKFIIKKSVNRFTPRVMRKNADLIHQNVLELYDRQLERSDGRHE